jgi:anion-transporting  ArsA/GET3 family ATPase
MLVDPRTAFVVVTTLETAPSHEAEYLAAALERRGMPLGAVIANRVLPPEIASPAAAESAAWLASGARGGLSDRVAERLGETGGAGEGAPDPKLVGDILAELGRRFDDIALVAAREGERRSDLERVSPGVVTVPWMRGDIHDLVGLAELAGHLRDTADPAESRR